jgi:AraC-like DNA-binding protein
MIKQLAFERFILKYLKENGLDVVGISRQLQTDAKGRLDRLHLLSKFAVDQTKEVRLGLLIGLQVSNLDYGVLGHALVNCRSLEDSHHFMLKHLWILQEYPKEAATLDLTEETMRITYHYPPRWTDIPHFFLDLFFAANLARSRELTGKPLNQSQLLLKRNTPDGPDRYSEILGIEVRFDQLDDQLIFPIEDALAPLTEKRVTHSKPYLRQCEKLLDNMQHCSGLTEQVRRYLLEHRDQSTGLLQMASHFRLEPRTFRRRLNAEGVTFRQIQQDVRLHLASSYLIHTHLSIADIAYLVGFYDAPTFNRGFVSWTGKTPSAYRRLNQPKIT